MLQQAEVSQVINNVPDEDCKVFGQAYDPNEEDCICCLDASDCKRAMEEAIKPKPQPKKRTNKKVEAKEKVTKEAKKPIIKIVGKDELKEYTATTLYHDIEYVELEVKEKIVVKKEGKKVTGKGMRKPPFNGRGGKGNTASYIEWLLYSGKWTFEELVKKGNYYLEKHGAKPVSTSMDKYIKGAIAWIKKNKNGVETITDGRIMVRI
jgi:hypothetical protein